MPWCAGFHKPLPTLRELLACSCKSMFFPDRPSLYASVLPPAPIMICLSGTPFIVAVTGCDVVGDGGVCSVC